MPPSPTYSYAELERALGRTFSLDSAQWSGPLRGRLKHLQRLGIGAGVGKGKRWRYPKEIAQQWLICLLLEEVGLDPTVAAKAVKANWEKNLSKWMELATSSEATDSHNHVYLLVMTSMMTANWKGGPSLVLWMNHYREPTLPPEGRYAQNYLLAAHVAATDRPLISIDFTIYANRLDLNLL